MAEERWVEVWKGAEPSVPGRLLDAEGIEMRLAAGGLSCGLPMGFLDLFLRRGARSRLLVRQADAERAKQLLGK